MKAFFVLLFILLAFISCQKKGSGYDLVSETKWVDLRGYSTAIDIERYENERDCLRNIERRESQQSQSKCVKSNERWSPMFERKPCGKWYVGFKRIQFAPHITVMDHEPPISDYEMNLRVQETVKSIKAFGKKIGRPIDVWAFTPDHSLPINDSQEKFLSLKIDPEFSALKMIDGTIRIKITVISDLSCENLAESLAELVYQIAQKFPNAKYLDMLFYLTEKEVSSINSNNRGKEFYMGLISEAEIPFIRDLRDGYRESLSLRYFPQIEELHKADLLTGCDGNRTE